MTTAYTVLAQHGMVITMIINLPNTSEKRQCIMCKMENSLMWSKIYCFSTTVSGSENSQLCSLCSYARSKKHVVLCGNLNVRHAITSQQVFKVISFCTVTCFHSFFHRSTMLCGNSAHVLTNSCH